MFFMMLGYAAFYFVRQNLSFATSAMHQNFGVPLSILGKMTTVFSLVYGIGKAVSGFVCDTHSVRWIFSIGLALSATISLLIGSLSCLGGWLIFLWGCNACFQSVGAPACAKLLTNWFGSKDFGTNWAIWGSSQQIGGSLIGLLIACILPVFGWRSAFLIPGVISLIVAGLVFWGIRDYPREAPLPSSEKKDYLESEDECADMPLMQVLKRYVLGNKMVWAMSIANFFAYFVKMIIGAWAPLFLCAAKGNSPSSANIQTVVFLVAGIVGSVLAGSLSDRFVNGYRGRVGFGFMAGVVLSTLCLWCVPEGKACLHSVIMLALGFFIVGPQTVIGVAAVDFSSKRVAGTASGITGTFGYLGCACAGMGTSYIAEHSLGWDGVFMFMFLASLMGCLALLPAWNARSASFGKQKARVKAVK